MSALYVRQGKNVPKICFLASLILAVAWCSAIVHAQSPVPYEEAVAAFQSAVYVNADNSVNVTELVTYETGPQERHGMYRDINPYSSEGRYMDIENVSVDDGNGHPYEWQRQSSGQDVRLKIGDPNSTFTGERTYLIHYTATNAVAHLESGDEIYWNATGNDWVIPVYNAQAIVYPPVGASSTQSACYYGPKGSTERCQAIPSSAVAYRSPSPLYPGDGLTIAAGFPQGFEPAYPPVSAAAAFFHLYLSWAVGLLIPLLVFVVMFVRWRKRGRDPKDAKVIIPEYDVPDGLTPLEVACIVRQHVGAKDISAELVYLATIGYLKICQTEKVTLGFIKSTDYQFVLLKTYGDMEDGGNALGMADQFLLSKLFEGRTNVGTARLLSDLKNKFYAQIPAITDSVVDAMLAKGYYSNLPKASAARAASAFFGVAFALIWFGMAFFMSVLSVFDVSPLPIFIGIVLAIVVFVVFDFHMPAKTVKGVAAKDYILGLKQYLQIAEKDRLAFHDAPAKKPEVFEKLLPFAMVLGVDQAWAKEFEDIYTVPPSWYEGYHGGVFNAVAFNSSLSSFNTAASTSLGSAPGGGGSGGGGFSGGGGGGGGGGGW